ncbi:hypothetical protein [Mucilaginibacter gotjawali]|uniref:Uncharacterized protein n=2 Tax=Mucilaginibacter gotjawali TaxID=1550579 RepID=A0A839SA17_9SPHI|nr:hypothetical protein [Mucilaginibacter gotjawali]MBB3054204.1 hypothetical protein [Mucilaginibacter gotjawali]BAU54475.1 hypothetical protein MgSA37_02651 [Mucilaginibacter gotjawali]
MNKIIYTWIIFAVKNGFILIFVALFILFEKVRTGFIPDYLDLEAITPHDLFGLMISSIASIIGIVIAVILLAFDITKREFIRSKEDILSNTTVKWIVSLFTFILLCSVLSFIQIKSFNEVSTLTIGYYLIFLYFAFIAGLFPAIRNILAITDSFKRTFNEINALSIENIHEVLRLQFENFSFNDSNKRLIRIRQQLIIFIREHDYESYTNILLALNEKAIELINKGASRRRTHNVVDALCFLWESAHNEALRVQNIQYFNTVWECVEQLYEYAATKAIPLMYFQELDFYVSNYISFLKRNNLNEPLYKGVYVLSKSFERNLTLNCPTQDKINDLYWLYENNDNMPHFVDESIQWDHITGFIMDLFSIQSDSIDLADRELFSSCSSELRHLKSTIINGEYKHLGPYQEAYLLEHILRTRIENEEKALKQNKFEMLLSSFDMESADMAKFARGEKLYLQNIMTMFSDFTIKLQYKELLFPETLNVWAAIARHLSESYFENAVCKRTFDYVVETMIFLKSYIEQHQLSSSQRIYNEIHNQIQSLKRYLDKDHPKKRMPIKAKITVVLKNFTPLPGHPMRDVVKW